MSEHSTTNTPAPESVTGLAITVGSLRSDLHHHIEDNERLLNELRVLVSDETTARETAHAELTETVAELASVIEEAVTAMQEYAARNGGKSSKAGTPPATTPGTPPERNRNENNKALYARLIVWAEDHGVDAPPKPTGGLFAAGYDKVLQPWRAKVVT
ncbi:MAG: hypothetical protein H0T72_02200 [Chloroflexia bacterium]|nr:hypothetical protein [Chloroflexia bacterium]